MNKNKEFLEKFNSHYAEIKEAILDDYKNEPNTSEQQKRELERAFERLDRVTDYNVPHGKKLRGLCAYQLYLELKISQTTADNEILNEKRAIVLGWCIELLQGAFLVADDIMDNSKMRRGQPCWYLNNQIGMAAINDSFFLIFAVYQVLRKYLSDHPMYSKFYELFNQVSMQTCIGQTLDLTNDQQHFNEYTEIRYDTIATWKTAYYSFYLPVACALYLAKIDDQKVHQVCKDILLKMGHFFQVQDDYLDCFGDPSVTGKIGTDIEDAKCCWLFIQALKLATPEQLTILKDNYGQADSSACVQRVKQVYEDLGMRDLYRKYEQEQYELIQTMINENVKFDSFTDEIRRLLNVYVDKIFKRNA